MDPVTVANPDRASPCFALASLRSVFNPVGPEVGISARGMKGTAQGLAHVGGTRGGYETCHILTGPASACSSCTLRVHW